MKFNFDLESIKYLEIEYYSNNRKKNFKLALSEKKENEFIAVTENVIDDIDEQQEVEISFIDISGLYKTTTRIKEIYTENDRTYFIIENPKSLDYTQNRNDFRILAEYDCIYTIDTEYGIQSYNATTYDISAGGVSITLEENILSLDESSILIFINSKNIKSHLKFLRCEAIEDAFRFVFEFTDLSDADYDFLKEFCIQEQLSAVE